MQSIKDLLFKSSGLHENNVNFRAKRKCRQLILSYVVASWQISSAVEERTLGKNAMTVPV